MSSVSDTFGPYAADLFHAESFNRLHVGRRNRGMFSKHFKIWFICWQGHLQNLKRIKSYISETRGFIT